MKDKFRYPGTQAFKSDQFEIYFGRKRDIIEFLRLLKLEQIVILYGKSGLGKTSLLNAGIIPKLNKSNFGNSNDNGEVVKTFDIRFGAFQKSISDPPIEVLRDSIWQLKKENTVFQKFGSLGDSLWLRLKLLQLSHDNLDIPIILIFDQFEEIFTYPPSWIEAFQDDFSGVINSNIPSYIQSFLSEEIRANPNLFTYADKNKVYSKINLKVVFSLRADYLSFMNQFTYSLPNILVNLYELNPLDKAQAKEAIIEPALLTDPYYKSNKFEYTPEALEEIVNALSNEQNEIESFQLQLVCRYLELKVISDPSMGIITSDHYAGVEGMKDILNNYYENSLNGLSIEHQRIARKFVEEGLISNGKRVAFPAGSELEKFGVTKNIIAHLLQSRLIRHVTIHLGNIYELSHDTFIEPVAKSYKQRIQEEERLKVEKELELQKKRVALESMKKRKARWFAILGYGLFAIAMIAVGMAYHNINVAKKSERARLASSIASKAWGIYRMDHTSAFRIAESALLIDPENENVKQTLNDIITNSATSFYLARNTDHNSEIIDLAINNHLNIWASCDYNRNIFLHTSGEDQARKLPIEHDSEISSMDFSSNGDFIVSVDLGGRINIWDIKSDSIHKSINSDHGSIKSVKFAHENNWFITVGADGIVRKWNIEGIEIASYFHHNDNINTVSISPNDKFFLTGSSDGEVILWNENGTIKKRISTSQKVNTSQFIPFKNNFIIGGSSESAEIFDFEGNRLAKLIGHSGEVTDISISKNGSFLATSSEDGIVKLWNLEGKELQSLVGHKKRINCISFLENDSLLVSGGYDFDIISWDVDYNLRYPLSEHSDFIYTVDVSSDGKYCLTSSKDGTARLWLIDGTIKCVIDDHNDIIRSAFFVPGREEIITASDDKTVGIWDYEGRNLLRIKHEASVNYSISTPKREYIISGTFQGDILIHNYYGELIEKWSGSSSEKAISSIDLNNDYSEFLTSSHDGIAKIWDFKGNCLDSIINSVRIYRAKYSLHQNSILTASEEYPVKNWSLSDSTKKQLYFGHLGPVYWIAYHPYQTLYATASWDKSVIIWDTLGNIISYLPHPNGVYSVAFTSDGNELITGSHDRIVRIWDLDGNLVRALGSRVNFESLRSNPQIAKLEHVDFSLLALDLESWEIIELYKNEPEIINSAAKLKYDMAMNNRQYYNESQEYFEKAIILFKEVSLIDSMHLLSNQMLATAYKELGELHLLHRSFTRAKNAFSNGLKYDEREYLIILEILSDLYLNNTKLAVKESKKYNASPIIQIPWYETYCDAFIGELKFFEDQYGIKAENRNEFLTQINCGN